MTLCGHGTYREKNGGVSVRGGVVGEHSSDEAVAECLGVGRESLRRAEPIALEPVGQHR